VKPVTFSKKTVTALLREGMEFEGLIVSDALDMGALANEYPPDEIAIRSVEAGIDVLLHPADARRTIDAVVRAVEQGRLTAEHIQESADRILAAKKRLGLLDGIKRTAPKISYDKHREIAAELAKKALKVVRGDKRKLPFSTSKGAACFILDDDDQGMGNAFRDTLVARFGDVRTMTLTPDACTAGMTAHLEPGDAGIVVVAVFSRIAASKGRSGIDPKLRDAAFAILRQAKAAKQPSALISFDSPYILDQFKDADVLIAGYDRMDDIQRSAAEMIAGSRGQ
jgi:beta-glucosidase-like glycosyl hydrolase